MVVYSIVMVKRSSSDAYNHSVINAIKRLRQFPALPKGSKYSNFKVLNLIFSP